MGPIRKSLHALCGLLICLVTSKAQYEDPRELNSFCADKPVGIFIHPSKCSQYLICDFGKALVKDCPPGLLFNDVVGICDYAINVECDTRGSLGRYQPNSRDRKPPPPPRQTHNANRVEKLPPPPKPEVHRTSPPRETKMVHSVHLDVPDVNLARLVSPRTRPPAKTPSGVYKCEHDGLYPDGDDCTFYVQCAGRQSYRKPCPSGTYFDPAHGYCGFDQSACVGNTHVEVEPEPKHPVNRPVVKPVPSPRDRPSQRPNRVTQGNQRPATSSNSAGSNDMDMDGIGGFMDDALEHAKTRVYAIIREEQARAKVLVGRRSAFSGVTGFLGSSPYVRHLSMPAFQQLECLRIIRERFHLGNTQISQVMEFFSSVLKPSGVTVTPDMNNPRPRMDTCPFPMNTENNQCNPRNRYRSYDGSCNNLKRPLWGKSMRPLGRFLHPDYSDAIGEPRVATDGSPLPSARAISASVFEDRDVPSSVHTIMLMTFGQFVDHDMSRTAVTKLSKDVEGEGEMVDVTCGDDGCQTTGAENRACLPILIPRNDPDFHNKSCLMFVRTQEMLRDDCSLGPREQLNQLTSHLDASMIYGSTNEEADKLRDKERRRGTMKTIPNPRRGYKDLLPQKDVKDCRDVNATVKCFTAGDGRLNEQIGLIAVHTAFGRYHNNLEEKLFKLNPHWDGERLFQEARRIMTALWQHLVYNEYLPIVLGPQELRKYGLVLEKNAYYNAYDDSVPTDVTNSFATAAFRFSHSMIDGIVKFTGQNYRRTEEENLSKVLRRPGEVYNNRRPGGAGIDSIMLGQISQASQEFDRFFSKEITTKLFSENPPHELGLDLAAINIQRGREHGIPSYNEWRSWCGLRRARSFNDLVDIPSVVVRDRFRSIYKSVDDIDLFAGGVTERRVPGGAVGPTFACIIGRQFRNLRVGDRFWYESNDPVTGFTVDQLREIRKITMSKLICESCDHVETIQKYVMLQPLSEAFKKLGRNNYQEAYSLASLYQGDNNERRTCDRIPNVDLTKWKD